MAVLSQSVRLGSPPGQRVLPETEKQRPSRAPRQQLILAQQMSERPLVKWPAELRLAIEPAQPLLATERRGLWIGRSLMVAFELRQLMGLLGSHRAKDFLVRLGRARRC
jgi:hypothetical protein